MISRIILITTLWCIAFGAGGLLVFTILKAEQMSLQRFQEFHKR